MSGKSILAFVKRRPVLIGITVLGALSLVAAIVLGRRHISVLLPWTLVQVIDDSGDVVSSEWILNKDPDRYAKEGAANLPPYVRLFHDSKARFTSLIVCSLDGERGFAAHKDGAGLALDMSFDWRTEGKREARARKFFEELNLDVVEDYLGGNGEVPDALRLLSWKLEDDSEVNAKLFVRVLSELCDIRPAEGLNITYEEKP